MKEENKKLLIYIRLTPYCCCCCWCYLLLTLLPVQLVMEMKPTKRLLYALSLSLSVSLTFVSCGALSLRSYPSLLTFLHLKLSSPSSVSLSLSVLTLTSTSPILVPAWTPLHSFLPIYYTGLLYIYVASLSVGAFSSWFSSTRHRRLPVCRFPLFISRSRNLLCTCRWRHGAPNYAVFSSSSHFTLGLLVFSVPAIVLWLRSLSPPWPRVRLSLWICFACASSLTKTTN